MITDVDRENNNSVERLRAFSLQDHPSTFRYFRNRIFDEAIKSHIVTLLYSEENGKDVGYAHIDMDTTSERAFFGICILPDYQSKGIGKLLIERALELYTGPLYLTVDKANSKAINLYKKYNFTVIEHGETSDLWFREETL